ncbi:MAG: Asp-tRNA(Asn)/Glu-tRNA(Gln) amidotransferase subunit GatB [Patescibacteria group bacterium]
MEKYQPVIGLEIHFQLNTNAKVFCSCSADIWEEAQNTHTCPVCLGLPGAVPVLNKKAFEDAVKMGLALNCSVSEYTYFERKNYFYPDLPKGFQISQKKIPLGTGGSVSIGDDAVDIWEIHLEEDTAKSTHTKDGTLLDFNKSGIPLVEIVSAPCIHSVDLLDSYAKEIQEIARTLGISACDMEKGQMRFEANVSIRNLRTAPRRSASQGEPQERIEGSGERKAECSRQIPDYRVEIKNLNSFKHLRDAVSYEIKRQINLLEKSETPGQETRGWDVARSRTFVQRSKEEAHDYRYFPEPDLPPVQFDSSFIEQLKEELPVLPGEQRERLESMGLRTSQAKILARDSERHAYFLRLAEEIKVQEAAKLVINQPETMNKDPQQVAEELRREKEETISGEAKLDGIAKKVIEENPEPVEDYRSGKEEAIQFLLGKIMRKTQGKADPQKAKSSLEKFL